MVSDKPSSRRSASDKRHPFRRRIWDSGRRTQFDPRARCASSSLPRGPSSSFFPISATGFLPSSASTPIFLSSSSMATGVLLGVAIYRGLFRKAAVSEDKNISLLDRHRRHVLPRELHDGLVDAQPEINNDGLHVLCWSGSRDGHSLHEVHRDLSWPSSRPAWWSFS